MKYSNRDLLAKVTKNLAINNDNDNDNEFLLRRMNRKKIVIHKINLQNKYAYIVKEITLIHKCRWHVTTLKQRVDCNIINR